MTATAHYELFRRFAADHYPGCTLEQKLEMYLSHHPVRAVGLLRELILAHYYTDWTEEDPKDDRATDTD